MNDKFTNFTSTRSIIIINYIIFIYTLLTSFISSLNLIGSFLYFKTDKVLKYFLVFSLSAFLYFNHNIVFCNFLFCFLCLIRVYFPLRFYLKDKKLLK